MARLSTSTPDERELWRAIRARHPGLWTALCADAAMSARHRGERSEFHGRLDAAVQIARLAWVSDAFIGQALYRLKARLQALGVPVLPRIVHRLAMMTAQITIGDPVVVAPGVYVLHGQLVVDGLTEIASGVTIAPFVTIGLRAGELRGPRIETGVSIGTGVSIIGPVRVGAGARIGAGAVVVADVAPGATVTGVPARALRADRGTADD